MPSWDNTARRQNTPTIVVNATPDLYGEWLSYLRAYTREYLQEEDNFIFINAWNEWGEGCHLEPDLKWSSKYLESTYRSACYLADSDFQTCHTNSLKNIVEIIDKSNVNDRLSQKLDIGATSSDFIQYRPAGAIARKISYQLSRFPVIHKLAKWIYWKMR
jgi:hypothetical protein